MKDWQGLMQNEFAGCEELARDESKYVPGEETIVYCLERWDLVGVRSDIGSFYVASPETAFFGMDLVAKLAEKGYKKPRPRPVLAEKKAGRARPQLLN